MGKKKTRWRNSIKGFPETKLCTQQIVALTSMGESTATGKEYQGQTDPTQLAPHIQFKGQKDMDADISNTENRNQIAQSKVLMDERL